MYIPLSWPLPPWSTGCQKAAGPRSILGAQGRLDPFHGAAREAGDLDKGKLDPSHGAAWEAGDLVKAPQRHQGHQGPRSGPGSRRPQERPPGDSWTRFHLWSNLLPSKSSYTEELYKRDLNNPDNHNGMITQLEPDILEYEVKWALGTINTKLVEVMEFQLRYFKS